MTNRMIEPITIKMTFNQVGMSTPARFSIASFYARNMIRAARSVIARRTREPAREQRGTSRWQLLDQKYTGCCARGRGRCLLLALSVDFGMSAHPPLMGAKRKCSTHFRNGALDRSRPFRGI